MIKVAIVTGASSGLGHAISIAYSKQGWSVVCGDLSGQVPVGESQTTGDLINEAQLGRAMFVSVNVSDSNSVQNLISTAVSQYGRLDVMVNNAKISLESHNKLGPKPITETADATFDQTMAVNTRSVFLGCEYAIRQFMTQPLLASGSRGWIINTSSVYGLKAETDHVSYCTSKAAVIHMTKCVARESAPAKIHCNVICPGFIRTGMDSNLHSNAAVIPATHSLLC
ncbi:hypothetical protein CGLO_16160 [Colletotrichum gloeosporioides Cg-14]|uniref:Short chain dehydrogenase n=1 Tax=Colletotrichum gloeosporioides (strain Cg-14) TaxID=1237896 RepID=T0L9Z1_COLGC|nr:hypothetical protein CGLO_16160 [Colletotrichum gloeosporioides Cg-14]